MSCFSSAPASIFNQIKKTADAEVWLYKKNIGAAVSLVSKKNKFVGLIKGFLLGIAIVINIRAFVKLWVVD